MGIIKNATVCKLLMSSLNLPKNVPLLPGNQFTDPFKVNHHKTQTFSVRDGAIQERTTAIEERVDRTLIESMRTRAPGSTSYGTRPKPDNQYVPRIQPAWLKYDRKVLCFDAYFQESVVEDKNENFRVRKCKIYYYLNDDTIHITEVRLENAGIPQGIFLKRQRVPKSLGGTDWYSFRDFNLATTMNFYERHFRICDCDTFTKEFYRTQDIPLNPPETVQTDNFEYLKSIKDIKIPPPDTKEYKEYFEVKLGGGHPNGGLKKYLENDRKTLSFDVVWDDRTPEGAVNYFTLNYFLSDDTVEVKEKIRVNSGKDPFPLLLRRGKLAKAPSITAYPGMSQRRDEFYGPQDLICGRTIVIYGRECLICNCDEFTRQWYKANFKLDQAPIELRGEKPRKYWQPIPPYNNYGNEEDSLGSVFSLQPKPPKKDYIKMFTSDQFILRFEARLLSENREDNIRKFILSFFCGDDTIQVYELTDRNSGIWGGKFLERSRYKNPITNLYYNERDLHIGGSINLGKWRFQLLKADEFTQNYMNERVENFPENNLDSILEKIRVHAKNYRSVEEFLIHFVRTVDANQNGYLEFNEFAEGTKTVSYTHLTLPTIYSV
eukprot:TRINITY_DN7644_c0_g1_i2.p1 TRINITY_DN7644_c0_g1~~TRINITY_DN7644_c0_g1_i2.p1  ORF type:complete len:663 (+),score=197.49 TRINITY_DN7644_c0_g1_i2:178-1989(+)